MIFVEHMYQKNEGDITPFLGGTVLGTAITTSLLGLVIKKYQIPVSSFSNQIRNVFKILYPFSVEEADNLEHCHPGAVSRLPAPALLEGLPQHRVRLH